MKLSKIKFNKIRIYNCFNSNNKSKIIKSNSKIPNINNSHIFNKININKINKYNKTNKIFN